MQGEFLDEIGRRTTGAVRNDKLARFHLSLARALRFSFVVNCAEAYGRESRQNRKKNLENLRWKSKIRFSNLDELRCT